jgi:hypothetical protein
MGAPQVTDTNYLSSLLAVTMSQYKEEARDNIFNNNAAFFKLKEKSQVSARTSGEMLQLPILLGKNESVKSFTMYDTFDNSPQKGIVNAFVKMSNYGGFIAISDDELDTNAGKEQVVNILTTKIMQCEGSILDEINDNLYKDGTGNSSKNILGLAAMCEASATPGAYMGLTNSTNWVNQYATGTSGAILGKLTDLWFACTDGRETPDIILANTKFAVAYEAANRGTAGVNISYVDAKLADAGFQALNFKGIPMVIDKSLDNNDAGGKGKAFMLNSKFLGLPLKEVAVSSFTESNTQFAKVAKMRYRLQLLTDKRKRQGVIVLS